MDWSIVGALAGVLAAVSGIVWKLYSVDRAQGERIAKLEARLDAYRR